MEKQDINIYCDESCHPLHDGYDIMALGGISLEKQVAKSLNQKIREIKVKHHLYKHAELKWTKVSFNKMDMYKELIDMFFEYDDIFFRSVVAMNKSKLNLENYNLTFDEWYHRIYYLLLREMVDIGFCYHMYLDIKDTKGAKRIDSLKDVLNRTLYDFYGETVKKIQHVRSDQIEIMGLVDIFTGAVSYKNRNLKTSPAKLEIIDYIEKKIGRPLNVPSKRTEKKFNIFLWEPRNV